jgi:hypothetical protein
MNKYIICIVVACLTFALTVGLAEYVPATEPPAREFQRADAFSPFTVTPDDLLPENVCQLIWAIAQDGIGSSDQLTQVRIDGDVLTICVTLGSDSIPDGFTYVDVASSRVSSVTDEILEYAELDDLWNAIAFDFPQASAFLTKDMVVDSQYGRYFDPVDVTAK